MISVNSGDFNGERAGHSSNAPGVIDRLRGRSVASISDLRWTGDVGTNEATGRLGNDFSSGHSRDFLKGSGRWLKRRTGLERISDDCEKVSRNSHKITQHTSRKCLLPLGESSGSRLGLIFEALRLVKRWVARCNNA